MFRVRYTQTPPKLTDFFIDRENVPPEFAEHPIQPVFKTCGLRLVASVANNLDTPSQFANRDH
ncbi:hypothetical protein BMD20_29555 [Burkholderia multivorans]|nr:hypothetical protein BMD20_29555 [Burkholderia multivorans]KHS10382.1 hypothetical protein BMD22_28270 [Burkholderia multivorans]